MFRNLKNIESLIMQASSRGECPQSLATVNLQGNLIEKLPANLAQMLPACASLNLLDNPLTADAELIAVVKQMVNLSSL